MVTGASGEPSMFHVRPRPRSSSGVEVGTTSGVGVESLLGVGVSTGVDVGVSIGDEVGVPGSAFEGPLLEEHAATKTTLAKDRNAMHRTNKGNLRYRRVGTIQLSCVVSSDNEYTIATADVRPSTSRSPDGHWAGIVSAYVFWSG